MSWGGSHVIQGHDHVMEGSMTDTLELYWWLERASFGGWMAKYG
jgi:hypothetical protein